MGEWACSTRWKQPLSCSWIGYYRVSLGGAVKCIGVLSNGGYFQSFGELLQVGRGNFGSYKIRTMNHCASLSPSCRAVPPMQMQYNECRSYSGTEVEEERAWSTPLWSVSLKVSETTRSGCGASGFLMCSLQFMSLSFPFRDLRLCLGVFLPPLLSSVYLTQRHEQMESERIVVHPCSHQHYSQ